MIELRPALATAASTCVIDIEDTSGLSRESVRIAVRRTGGPLEIIRPGQRVLVDRNPGGTAVVPAQVAVVYRGYVSGWRRVQLRRGGALSVPLQLKPARIAIRLATEHSPLSGAVELEFTPIGAGGLSRHGVLRIVTDDRGRSVLDTVVGARLAVRVRNGPAWIPPGLSAIEATAAVATAEVPTFGLLETNVVATVSGNADAAELRMGWHNYTLPDGLHERLVGLVGRMGATKALARYHAGLPASVPATSTGSTIRAILALLPGSYLVSARTKADGSLPQTVAIESPTGLIELVLARERQFDFEIIAAPHGEGERRVPPLLLAAVIGHRANWDERFTIYHRMGRLWGDKAKVATVRRDESLMVNATRKQYRRLVDRYGAVPRDVAIADASGKGALQAAGRPSQLTVLWPNGLAAVVPVGKPGAPIIVRPEHISELAVRILDSQGRPLAGYRLFANAAAQINRGRLQIGRSWKSNEDGWAHIGLLAGERIGLFSVTDGFIARDQSGSIIDASVDAATGRRRYVAVTMPRDGTHQITLHRE